MKKLFLLIPALVLALATNAAVINITTTSPHSSNNLRQAIAAAASGDIIEMAAGTYEESGDYLAFTGKEVTVRAAEGAEVIIRTVCPVRLKEGAKAEFVNVKFDCSTIGSYDYVIVPADDTDNKRVVLTGCEFYGWDKNKAMIEATSARRLAAVTIDNCYFHDCMKSVVFIENTGSIDLSITNSTFANIATNTESFSAGVIDSRASSGSFLVDHCTFYNVLARNTDYAAIGKVLTPGAVVSNCIFVLPTSTDGQRAIRDVAQANNCLTFNYVKDSGGIHGDVVKNNCIFADPLFTDAANDDFSFAGNWITMQLSPARGAATDGSDLGDPRWYSAEVLPDVDFATPYQFIGTKALLAGQIGLNTNDHIEYYDTNDKGTATWKIHATRPCVLSATLNMETGSSSGHIFKVSVLDAYGNTVGEMAEPSQSNHDGNIDLPGILTIPAAGNYTVILYNLQSWSQAKLEGITFTYVGGEVQNMPGTTAINEAWFSANGTRTGGAIEYTSVGSGCWAKWNIAVANQAWYNVIVNIKGQYGHDFTVEFLKEGETTPIVVTKNATNYSNDLTLYANDLGLVELEAANYEMKVSNSVGDAAIISVTLAYSGGNVINVSPSANTTLPVADAWFTSTCVREDGKIEFKSDNVNSWIKWNIATSATAFYDITVNIEAPNAHEFAVAIYEDENASPVASFKESFDETTGSLALELGKNINLTGGKSYVVKVTNVPSGSKSKVINVVFAPQVSSSTITLPTAIDLNDAHLSDKAHITDGALWFNTIGDSNPVGQWAEWEVTADHAGTYLFTMGVSSTNGQIYKITILDSGNNEVAVYEKNAGGSGDKTISHYFYLEAGSYFIKVENTYAWSQGHIVSLVVTEPSILALDQAAANNSVIEANYRIDAQPIQIIRTIKGGTYNTICLPFDVSSSQLTEIFGSDVVLKELESSAFDAEASVLDLNFVASSSIYRGTPYIIRPSRDIVNPVFDEAIIKEKTGQSSVTTNVDFIGTFVATEIPAGEDNLFLGPNNLLYFSPDAATAIKGFRGWFVVHDIPGGAKMIKKARIVEGKNVITAVDLVKDENVRAQKVLRDGQLIIIRDGAEFTVQGQRIQ